MRKFKIGLVNDIGLVKKSNRDNLLVKIGEAEGEEFGLFVVADGVDGMCFGDMASNIAVKYLKEWWNNNLLPLLTLPSDEAANSISNQLLQVIINVNNQIYQYGLQNGEKGGTTLSVLFIYRDFYIIKNCGDSRVYYIDEGNLTVTKDDSWVFDQIALGKMTKNEARVHPKRNLLTKCIGVFENINIYESLGKLKRNHIFMLSSDGVHSYFSEDEIKEKILECQNLKDSKNVQSIADGILEQVYLKGAVDNISLIFVVP